MVHIYCSLQYNSCTEIPRDFPFYSRVVNLSETLYKRCSYFLPFLVEVLLLLSDRKTNLIRRKTTRLQARHYDMIVDSGFALMKYYLIEISSPCFCILLTFVDVIVAEVCLRKNEHTNKPLDTIQRIDWVCSFFKLQYAKFLTSCIRTRSRNNKDTGAYCARNQFLFLCNCQCNWLYM